MSILLFAGVTTAYWAEARGNPLMHGVAQQTAETQAGGNMEGKEVRFGIANSALFATATTDASCGAVNGMHDSFMPLGGMVPLANIMLGEIIFGGVGAGMYGMLIFVVLSVFIAGLMVGRTPEYLGKKIEAYDVKMAMLYVLIFPLLILGLAAVTVLLPHLGLSSLANHGPHGLSEILYAFTSAAGNNGSAFAGLNANTHYYNLTLGIAMLMWAFSDDRAHAGGGWKPGEEKDRSGIRGHFSGDDAAIHDSSGWSHFDRRRVDLLSSAHPGSDS